MQLALTMRKHAPIITAFILTSRSMGNWIPKLSESVNASRRSPVHCLLIFPILLTSSIVKIWGKSYREDKLQTYVALGQRSVPKLVWFYWKEIMIQFIIPSNCSFMPAATVTWVYVLSVMTSKQLRRMVISCFSYSSSGSGKRSVSLTQIPFTAQSNKTSWAMEQWPHCTTQEHALCDGFIQATAHSDWKHISCFRARGGSLTKNEKSPENVTQSCYDFTNLMGVCV